MLAKMGDTGQYRTGIGGLGPYNHNPWAAGGQIYQARNMSLEAYPLLSSRRPRGRVRALSGFNGMTALEGLVWVEGDKLYYRGQQAGLVEDSPKTMAAMGGRVVILPDKVMYDTVSGQLTALEAQVTLDSAAFAPSRMDGRAYEAVTASDTAPQQPQDGDCWADTSGSEPVLKVYSQALGSWSGVTGSCVKISAAQLGQAFKVGDGVRIAGANQGPFVQGGGDHVVLGAGEGWITVAGSLSQGFTAQGVTVARQMPDMDYLVECGNRLWGCSSDGRELYACKLGDPTNWRCYQGLSTDSYAATVGSPGPFTGAAVYQGYAMFFKADRVLKVFGSRPSNFQIADSPMEGVGAGCGGSLAAAGDTLFYLNPFGVFGYDGALPWRASQALGPGPFQGGQGAGLDGRYYLSMAGAQDQWGLYVYDTRWEGWMPQDGMKALAFARDGERLYAVDQDGVLWSLDGYLDPTYADSQAALEGPVEWMVETGDMGMDSPDKGYVGRICLRAQIQGWAQVWVCCDGKEPWYPVGRVQAGPKGSWWLPFRPRRCDHFRLRITGSGPCQLYGLALLREDGSEL